jgi:hypothetical protein
MRHVPIQLHVLAVALAGAIFFLNISLPLGVSVGVLYVAFANVAKNMTINVVLISDN